MRQQFLPVGERHAACIYHNRPRESRRATRHGGVRAHGVAGMHLLASILHAAFTKAHGQQSEDEMTRQGRWGWALGLTVLLLMAHAGAPAVTPSAQAEALQQARERTTDRNRDARQRSTDRRARSSRQSARTERRARQRTEQRGSRRTQERTRQRSTERSTRRSRSPEARTTERRRSTSRSVARSRAEARDTRATTRSTRSTARSSSAARRAARGTPRTRTGQRSRTSAPRATNRGVTSPRGSVAPARRTRHVVIPRRPAPPPPRVIRYTTLRPRRAYFSSFHLSIYINRVISQRPGPIIVRSYDQRRFAYEVGQEFIRDFLPRGTRARFPRYRRNSRLVTVEYLGAGEYFIAGTMRVRERGFRGSFEEAFELIISDRPGGWELLEIYLESY